MSECMNKTEFFGANPVKEISTASPAGMANVTEPNQTSFTAEDTSVTPTSERQLVMVTDNIDDISANTSLETGKGLSQKVEMESTITEQGGLSQPQIDAEAEEVTLEKIDKRIQYRAMPYEITLPNLTLGRDTFVEYKLPNGITLADEYAADGRPWMETKEVKIEKSESGFRVFPKDGITGIISFDVFYNDNKTCRFNLTINPDPWSLWTAKDPADELIKFAQDKDRIARHHKSSIYLEDGNFTVIGASRRGRSHEHSGTFRDDDLGMWADETTGRYVFIVADGAGSARYSREGSRMAIQILKEKLPANLTVQMWNEEGANLQSNGKVGVMLASLARYAYGSISEFVNSENKKHPEDKWEVRDFNTTLLVAAVKCDPDGSMRLVTFSIGDGAIAWFDGDKAGLMCAPDGGEFSGGTRFLTTRSVWEKATKDWPTFYKERVFCKKFSSDEAKKITLFLMTDGVSDPWFETDASLNDSEMWSKFAKTLRLGDGENRAVLKPEYSAEKKAQELTEWLHFKIKGNHDDRTLIIVQPRNGGRNQEGSEEVANA